MCRRSTVGAIGWNDLDFESSICLDWNRFRCIAPVVLWCPSVAPWWYRTLKRVELVWYSFSDRMFFGVEWVWGHSKTRPAVTRRIFVLRNWTCLRDDLKTYRILEIITFLENDPVLLLRIVKWSLVKRIHLRARLGINAYFVHIFLKEFDITVNSVDSTLWKKMNARSNGSLNTRQKSGCDPKRLSFFRCAVKQLTISFFSWVTPAALHFTQILLENVIPRTKSLTIDPVERPRNSKNPPSL